MMAIEPILHSPLEPKTPQRAFVNNNNNNDLSWVDWKSGSYSQRANTETSLDTEYSENDEIRPLSQLTYRSITDKTAIDRAISTIHRLSRTLSEHDGPPRTQEDLEQVLNTEYEVKW